MKTLLSLLALFAGLSMVAGCDSPPAAQGDAQPKLVAGDVNTVSFSVPSMTCDGCAAVVEETLAKTSGIEQCVIDLENQIATCKINPDKYKAEDVLKALADAGYKDSTVKN